MAITGGASKQKTKGSQQQQFDQTAETRLSDRAYGMINDRANGLGQQEYKSLDPNAYKAFMDPYEQEVINATTADINANRALEQNSDRANFASAGAFGDDRRGIVEAETTGKYDRTLATTLAGLRSGGFRQAQGVAQTENSNRNQFDAMTQQQINQLLARLSQETTTTGRGTSSGTSTGSNTGFNLGFGWSPAGGFNG